LRSIPKGLHLSAQGCEERATLGETNDNPINPERVVADSSWRHKFAHVYSPTAIDTTHARVENVHHDVTYVLRLIRHVALVIFSLPVRAPRGRGTEPHSDRYPEAS